MKPVCLACDVTPLDSQDRDLKPGERGITGWRITNPPKHGGGCSEHWPGIGKTEPPSLPDVNLLELVDQAGRETVRVGFVSGLGMFVGLPTTAGAPQRNASPITGSDLSGEVAAFHYATCDCGCGQTFDRCKTRTPDEAFQAAKAQYAARLNGKPVAPRKSVSSARTGVKAKTRHKRKARP